jgi:hypothetical protein
MKFSRFALSTLLVLGLTQAAAAQSSEPTGTGGSTTPGVVATIDVTRLPIDLQRIERHFRQGQIREERDGLNLRYFVDVFAKAPNLVLLTKQDNLQYGPVPKSAPTHSDMLEMMTPREFRNHGGVNILSPTSSKK